MKKTFKSLIVAVILMFTLTASLIPAYAYDGEASTSDVVSDAIDTRDEEKELDANIFSTIFNEIKSYATEIFCAMTFVGSLILAYAYKKGLMPLIEKALLSIGSSVAKIKEKTESGVLAAEELSTSITTKLDVSEVLITNLVNQMKEMNEELTAIKTSESERTERSKELAVIVGTQIDMLHDIFMTSALPQYQKDAVGERVAKMKEALKENAKEE